MKLLKWVQFTWELEKVPAQVGALPAHYQISPATVEDEMALRKIFSSSFLLDPAWNPAIGEVMQTIQTRLDAALSSEGQTCLALRHGQRIIGAAVLNPDPAAMEHLAIGPSILPEYRNRGFGALLLHACLLKLQEAGMTSVSAMAPDYVPVTRFLYPKFDSRVLVQPTALLAA
jgi:GNAT superfamily N-acetyltransferase